ncbi:alpha/beta hydrolase family protein [Alteromonas gilva]|uniref:Alpha/beta hydrolase n=1 Tax=Alteromonas gilva TaxID=2987522 RepID=A0ABT5KWY8_9ALTE|nr:hypothetical protein [Alteromonas gilva]MDC8829293.1 hypothetical protein [Alteromonas gilva]
MKYKLTAVLILISLYIVIINCSPPLYLTFTQPAGSPEYADTLYKVSVTRDGKGYSLTMLGYDGAKQVSERPNWNKLLIVSFRSADGFLSVKKYPLPHIKHSIEHVDGNDLVKTDKRLSTFALNTGLAQLTLTPPGFYGSTGREEVTFTRDGIKIMSKAVEKLVDDFGAESVIIVGGSHPGNIAAGVMSFYSKPIHCAIISSAPLDLNSPYRNLPFQDYSLRTPTPFNPIAWVSKIPHDDNRTIYIAYSKKDLVVDWRMTSVYADKLTEKGYRVIVEESPPSENRYFHDQSLWHYYKIKACAESWHNRTNGD